ncbi:ABC transporter ATP-binding protein [Streptomyces sp. NPDC012769]|uniref:ABC transporter ATP-binding protein n=1 Tax=Streptomyces sp. NPDC012769 TaxID=3364848 RepID=UPI003694A1F7
MNAANDQVLRALQAVTAERAGDALLSVRGLTVRFRLRGGRTVAAVTDATFDLAPGECLALVGESGCGKSVLASALLGLLPANAETRGTALLAGGPGTPGVGGAAGRRAGGADARGGDGLRAAVDGYGSPARGGGPGSYGGAVGRRAGGVDRHGSVDARGGDGPRAAVDGHGSAARGGGPGSYGGDRTAGRGPERHADPDGGSGAREGDGTGCPPVVDLLAADERTLARTVRGRRIGLVPQSPAAHLTPVRTVRAQLEETVRALTDTPRRERRAAAEAAAERAAFPPGHLDRYPHELSGGLAQRAATALALIGDAPLLLADEPTTGLDRELVDRTADELRRHADQGKALLLITHDLAAARRVADRVAVMYAGRIVEIASADRFFGEPGPRHPYARGLLDALPERTFTPIPGLPPELSNLPDGCAFAPRCAVASDTCATRPDLLAGVACHHPDGAFRA